MGLEPNARNQKFEKKKKQTVPEELNLVSIYLKMDEELSDLARRRRARGQSNQVICEDLHNTCV